VLDGGLVVGYLAVALGKGARRVADAGIDALLDRLTGAVQQRLGRPDPAPQQVEQEMRRDPGFEAELSALVRELDARGARQFLNQVNARENVQSFGEGWAVSHSNVTYNEAHDPTDLTGAPAWVKLAMVLGSLLAFGAFVLFGYTLFTDMPELGDPDFMEVPAGIPLAGAIFLAGFFLLGVAGMGRSLSRRR
jgi:hypothetical protein